MILHSIKVSNWKTLNNLELGPLSAGVTVIHAPNKTGKSSLADAIVKTLVDFNHSTSRIEPYVPWGTNEIPEVEIEFEVGGKRYLLNKRFSNRKGGGAELYRVLDGDGREKIATGNEATRQTRQILGLEKSNVGVAQLLWVKQGTVAFPHIDDELNKSLRPLLGTIMTSPLDDEFRAKLENKIKEWFTPGNIKKKSFLKFKKDSPPDRLEKFIQERKRAIEEIEERFRKIEDDIKEANRLATELAGAGDDVNETEQEIERLKAEEARIQEKKEKTAKIESELSIKLNELSQLDEAYNSLQASQEKISEIRAEIEVKKDELSTLRAARESAQAVFEKCAKHRKSLEKKLTELDYARRIINAKTAILQLDTDIKNLEQNLKTIEDKNKSIRELKKEVASILTPDEKTAARIKKLVDDRVSLSAELKASGLALSIEPEKAFSFNLAVDDEAEQTVALERGEPFMLNLRQRLKLTIPQIGKIEVRRGKEDESVDEIAAEFRRASDELEKLLAPLGIDKETEHSSIISEVEGRIRRKKELEDRIEELQEEMETIVPGGIDKLADELALYRKENDNLLNAYPHLKTWKPSRKNLNEEKRAFEAEEKSLKEDREKAKREEDVAKREVERVEEAYNNTKNAVTLLENDLKHVESSIESLVKKYGESTELAEKIGRGKETVEEIRRERERHRLTPQENAISEELRNAELALKNRKKRYEQIRESIIRVEESLKGTEGLQPKRTAAEQALHIATRDYRTLLKEINAHCMLLELFDEIRNRNIQETIGPVRDKINSWLREIEGERSGILVFDNGLEPDKIKVQTGECVDIENATSYGEREQLATVVRLAMGTIIGAEEPQVVILDDPLAHSDPHRHRKTLSLLGYAARENLQIIVLTCHPNRFDYLQNAHFIDLADKLRHAREGSGGEGA